MKLIYRNRSDLHGFGPFVFLNNVLHALTNTDATHGLKADRSFCIVAIICPLTAILIQSLQSPSEICDRKTGTRVFAG